MGLQPDHVGFVAHDAADFHSSAPWQPAGQFRADTAPAEANVDIDQYLPDATGDCSLKGLRGVHRNGDADAAFDKDARPPGIENLVRQKQISARSPSSQPLALANRGARKGRVTRPGLTPR